MSKRAIYVIIMAGGAGTRLWPQSRQFIAKQFLDLLDVGESLLQSTYKRMLSFTEQQNMIVVAHARHASLVAEQLPDLSSKQILSEPFSKNTAPCIAYASYKLLKQDPDSITIVVPSDHHILLSETFKKELQIAISEVENRQSLTVLGIHPTQADTNYGYIEFEKQDVSSAKSVRKFTEKPNLDTAKRFLEKGNYLWNAGIFVWKTQDILEALEKYSPAIATIFKEGVPLYDTEQEPHFLKKAYALVPNISIDYAVLEPANNIRVVPCTFSWSDLGSWNTLYQALEKDENQNVFLGKKGRAYDSTGNLIKTYANKLVVIEGLEDYLVADTKDVLLICRRKGDEKFRTFVRDLKEEEGEAYI